MLRQVLWLAFDAALGALLTGVLAPLTVPLLPKQYRGPLALWCLVLVSVASVSGLRRAAGIGTVDRSK